MDVLDLGDPLTLPDEVLAVVEELVEEVRTWPDVDADFPACDLLSARFGYSEQVEPRLRAALDGHLFAAYHATRLLPHEIPWVESEGLRILTDDLVDEKLARAADAYPELLTDDEQAHLRRSGQINCQRTRNGRIGLLHDVTPFSIFEERPWGFLNLLRSWGGEAVGWTDNDQAGEVVARFTAESTPAIVEVAIGVGEVPRLKNLWHVPVGSLLGLPEATTGFGLEAAVPGDRVIDVIQPGDPRWPERLTL